MVRHHVKKKKGGANASKKQQDKDQLEAELKNLDRFAGSSDEESDAEDQSKNNDDDENEGADIDSENESSDGESDNVDPADSDDGISEEDMKEAAAEHTAPANNTPHEDESNSEESDNDYQDANDEVDSDEDNFGGDTKALGMSNAMSRILGGSGSLEPKKAIATTNVVLSKTTTPLQRLQQKIKNEEAALRQKRRERRSENLLAMRLPLAPTAGMSAEKLKRQKGAKENDLTRNAKAIALEIESERTHRRIATRGVVALFNAISKHRSQVAAEQTAKEEEKKRLREEGGIKRKQVSQVETSKHGFLDMIKNAAVKKDAVNNGAKDEKASKGENESEKKGVGWSALKDDFMMNSKLKVRISASNDL